MFCFVDSVHLDYKAASFETQALKTFIHSSFFFFFCFIVVKWLHIEATESYNTSRGLFLFIYLFIETLVHFKKLKT